MKEMEMDRDANEITRRTCLKGLVAGAALAASGAAAQEAGGKSSGKGAGAVRIARFQVRGRTVYGIVDGERVKEVSGPFGDLQETGPSHSLAEVKLLPPAEPSKVLALAGNYRSHLQGEQPVPKNPELFIKTPSSLLEPGGAIVIPPGTADVHFEGELVVVMGRRAKDIAPADVPAHVLGYACGNDVSARDWQKGDRQWWRAKACDTFSPLGPWVVKGIDPSDLKLVTRLNGKVVQESSTKELIFDVPAIVSFVSRHMTLLPGDLIYTGTPGTTSAMKSGDVVEVEIDGLGILKNRIA